MEKLTAVDWLIQQICGEHTEAWKEEIQQALIMEKEQIINAYLKDRPKAKIEKVLTNWDKAEKYYNETFSNKVD